MVLEFTKRNPKPFLIIGTKYLKKLYGRSKFKKLKIKILKVADPLKNSRKY